jgi:hypothetical protein
MNAPANTDDELCSLVSSGHMMDFIVVALTKRVLQTPNIKPGDKLYLLEKLNGMTDIYFRAEMLAMIEPAGDIECQIISEANSLDPPDDTTHGMASYRVLTSPNVFQHFLTLNPSILAAIKWREAWRGEGVPGHQDINAHTGR